MFKSPSRGLWVCTQCVRQASRGQQRRWMSAVSGAAPSSITADHSPPGRNTDDAILRELFDSPDRVAKAFKAAGPSVGLFKNRYLTSPNGFYVFARRSLEKAQKIVHRVLHASSISEYQAVVKDLDRLSDLLCRVLDLSDFVRMTHPDPRFQQAAAGAWSMVYQYMNQLNTMTGLSDQLVKAMGLPDVVAAWSEEERTVAEILKLDFTKSAVDLPQQERDRFVDLSQQISEVGSMFVSDMAPAKREIVLPSSSFYGLYPGIARALTMRGKLRLPTTGPEAQAALRSVKDEGTRKEVFTAMRTASKQTVRLLETMLKLRSELANLAGFSSYAHLSLKDRMMAKSPGAVMQFLQALQKYNTPIVQEEMADLLKLKQTRLDATATQVNPWDKDFLMDGVRSEMRLPVRHPDHLPSFFSIGTVMQGMSRLFTRLYGIQFKPRESQPGETWHEDVRRLDVVTDTGELIAVLYCDLFFREDKSPNPAHFTVRCSRAIAPYEVQEAAEDLHNATSDMPKFERPEQAANDGMESSQQDGVLMQLPTIALVCDFPKHDAGSSAPALLSYYQVETLFHEMGHAIHSILARTKLQNVSGTRCATDFAELPSTLMEHFAADPSVLGLFARHWKTDEPLPYQMVAERIRLAKRFEGIDTENQILLSLLDQSYHAPEVADSSFDSTQVYHNLQRQYSQGGPDPPGTCWQGFFGHLHGYGSTYYSYVFDRVLAERVWRVVFRAGADGKALDRANGERLKENLLKWGGSRDPWQCLADTLQDDRLAKGDDKAMALVGSWGIKDDHA
ncbi:mitochondrial intermediate peptidase [Colletotrichum spaethianum]|uniref:Mitochondrial intermediate peptidase n=1 Tax=Colletotrichum spaethianum TaxID=700344 RepID=A0AA37NZG1_9PEZI|nr:mitochondrial intermediate peptidase [Colletotrichum spaethianum]GKT42113.1 mitochondrial intermediate peptidase [Colletotrichum spaethianum]